MAVTRSCSPRALAELLCRRPVRFAYPLGYLDAAYQDHCSWYGFDDGGRLRALVLVYRGLSRPALFICGDPRHAALILAEAIADVPEQVSGHVPEGHMEYIEKYFRPSDELQPMQRMGLQRRNFYAEDYPNDERVQRLSHRDTGAIMQIYAHYPDNYFEPVQLETGLYFGVAHRGWLAGVDRRNPQRLRPLRCGRDRQSRHPIRTIGAGDTLSSARRGSSPRRSPV